MASHTAGRSSYQREFIPSALDATTPSVRGLEQLDSTGLWRRLLDLPDQVSRAWQLAIGWSGIQGAADIRRVVVIGMGGSAIGAQLAARLVMQRCPVSIEIVKDSCLPALDEHTLLIFSSFSGETEEVLTALRAGSSQPCAKLAVTRGGTLAREAVAAGIPTLLYEYEGEPRSAIGYGVMLLLGVLHRLGLFPVTAHEVDDATAELAVCARAQGPNVAFETNPARSLARHLTAATPVILADASLGPAAVRWQNQINENSKRWAFPGVLPEALHNMVEGMRPGSAGPALFRVILLEDLSRAAVARARIDALERHLCATGIPWTRLAFSGSSDLSILLQACMMGDWVSYYLALDSGEDPAPVPVISGLKQHVVANQRAGAVGGIA